MQVEARFGNMYLLWSFYTICVVRRLDRMDGWMVLQIEEFLFPISTSCFLHLHLVQVFL